MLLLIESYYLHTEVFQNSEINTTNIANNPKKKIISAIHEKTIQRKDITISLTVKSPFV